MATQKNLIHTELLATDNTSVPVDRAAASIHKFDKAAKKANKEGLRMMRGGLGQVGHQIQDVAVQLQMGQNAMLVFGQQGSQIASLFGKNGALIGAVIAVGAAVATSLAPAFFNTRKHLEEFQEVAANVAKVLRTDASTGIALFTEEMQKLAKVSENLARTKLQVELVDATIAVSTAFDGARASIEEFDARTMAGNLTAQRIGELRQEMGLSVEDAKRLAMASIGIADGNEKSLDSFQQLISGIQNSEKATTEQIEAYNKLKRSILENIVNMKTGEITVKNLTDLQDNFNEKMLESSPAYKEANEAVEQFLSSITSQTDKLGLTKAEVIAYNASLHDLTTAQQEIVDAAIEKTLAHEAEIERVKELKQLHTDFTKSMLFEVQAEIKTRKELAKVRKTAQDELTAALDKEQKNREIAAKAVEGVKNSLMTEEEAIRKSYSDRQEIIANALANQAMSVAEANTLKLQSEQDYYKKLEDLRQKSKNFEDKNATEKTQMVLDGLGETFKGVQANNKKMFAVQKAYSIAQAIMSTYAGASKAIETYPPPLSFAMAAAQVAAGMSQVAQIRAQSFDGGGFTGRGSRSGGMDGKGGFPAILHPNETVVDHTKGQSGGITIVNNIDATGAGADVDMKIRAAVQQSSQQTIMSIQDLIRRRRFG